LRSFLAPFEQEFVELAEINIKYEGYIRKEEEMVQKMSRLEDVHLHADFDYLAIPVGPEQRSPRQTQSPQTAHDRAGQPHFRGEPGGCERVVDTFGTVLQ
jgi:tRNA U34 5-carboxymethylaminomethyl modifying enzyme MnmG/GidA